MILSHVKEIMDRQNKTGRGLAAETGLAINTVSGLYHDTSKRVDMETLNRLCKLLKVGIGELIKYKAEPFGIRTTLVEPGGIRTNFLGGNAVYGQPMEVYHEQEAGQFTRMMKGELPGMDTPEAFNRVVVGDPEKMAQRIIERVDAGGGPLRMALGSDAYHTIREALLERLAALEAQKELAYSTDADDVVQPV
ncbi:helix-turn-helix domain-containing protein [Paenibacillus sp. S150]|uniref:helix-turn-helix domain-containing protein n=1 Tax=Paenibacillus sp. S150 TaxID=2749826 RepID=UPI001C5798AC|nr:helix-turn-helix domain-containing protein [Paenibacillus sp. S150]MBW4081440.1 helix-turn-helix domain-containing protein [Paenibacillus sp. S150]